MKKNYRGFGFITSQLYKNGIIDVNKFGIKLRLRPYEAIDEEIIHTGYFDEPVLNAILEQLNPNEIFWDIGANIGLHSFAVKKIIPTASCHSFEPYYKNFEKLRKNQELNIEHKLNTYNFGLSDSVSIEEIFTTKNNHGRSGFIQMTDSTCTNVKILTTTGNELIKLGLSVPNVIKLDTEGLELRVLKGCSDFLDSQSLRAIIYEAWSNQDSIAELLASHNFEIKKLHDEWNYIALRLS